MNNQPERISLFNEFPPVSTADWEARILSDLKGADYEKKLIRNTPEGFRVKPYYRFEDLQGMEYLEKLPEMISEGRQRNEWLICQDIATSGDAVNTIKRVKDALSGGAQSIHFRFSETHRPGKQFLSGLLDLNTGNHAEFQFSGIENYRAFYSSFRESLQKKNISLQSLRGSLGFDPIGKFTLSGKIEHEADHFDTLAEIFEESVRAGSKMRVLEVNGRYFQDSGATLVQELGYALSVAVDYLDKLSDRGIDPARITGAMQFNFSTGPDYFMEIAKLRAVRILWDRICDAYKIPAEKRKIFIHSTTSSWNLTLYDPYVNMLRAATETMSAILGGADSIAVLPYDHPYGKTREFSDRIARNTQIILKEEAYFDKVPDPSAGSYYIENLTHSLAQEAWDLFRKTETEGGYLKSFVAGTIQHNITASLN
ncbi:MAG TPA: methylmalonyl-CoA mutase small subunit, partial [Bacteroidaceae bacterium]|nr:methylmalonyl-CoA mutase small subunit [Bacteroidaceae bacterium]